MQLRVVTVEQFLRRPEGAVVFGNDWLYYCVDRAFLGVVAWGGPTMADYHALEPCMDLALDKPHVSILDARRLARLGTDVFAELARFGDRHRERAGRNLRRQVVLPPVGYTRAVLVGWRELVKPPYDVVFVDTEADAATASERPDALELFAEVARLRDAPLSAQVAQLLLDTSADVGSIARQLALAPRTLQRRLASEGTSFAQIAQRTMVERAKHLLATSDDKLEVIARRVGYPSPSHFTASFRRVTGMTPSAWRTRNTREP